MKKSVVIYVDDEIEMHELFQYRFRKETRSSTFSLLCFENGNECIQFLKSNYVEHKIILVITDLNMPLMDGYDFLMQVKQEYPELKVSIASAYSDGGTKDRVQALGAEYFFEKPLNFDSLRSVIQALL